MMIATRFAFVSGRFCGVVGFVVGFGVDFGVVVVVRVVGFGVGLVVVVGFVVGFGVDVGVVAVVDVVVVVVSDDVSGVIVVVLDGNV